MPVQINQPANRISLTNISLVRLKKGKKRFEIACYKNKLLEYRSGQETDLDNVLQVPTIFLNVSKGQTAPTADLQKAFGKEMSRDDMIAEILKKGEVQVGAGERKELLDRIEKEVVELVSQRVVDPETKRVYTTGMITKALDLLSKQAGHAQQGLDTTRHLDKDEDGGVVGEEEQAGYMGLGKLDINDVDDDDVEKPTNKHQNKRSAKNNKKSKPTPTSTNDHHNAHTLPLSEEDDQTPSNPTAAAADPSSSQPRPNPTIPTWTGVSTSKPPKAQALEAMKALIYHQPIPIQRARMRLRISIPASYLKTSVKVSSTSSSSSSSTTTTTTDTKNPSSSTTTTTTTVTLKQKILSYVEQVENQDMSGEAGGGGGGEWEVTGFVEPGAYKGLGEFVGQETKGRGRVEVLDMAVTHED